MLPSMSSKQPQSSASLRHSRSVELLSSDIAGSRHLAADTVWVVDREVHVLDGAELSIDDKATILILNGVVESSALRRAALIFDPGSKLTATRFSVRAGGRSTAAHVTRTMGAFGSSEPMLQVPMMALVLSRKSVNSHPLFRLFQLRLPTSAERTLNLAAQRRLCQKIIMKMTSMV